MRVITATVAAATLAVGFAVSASAMPVQKNLRSETIGGVQPEQARVVCNRWGRCWRTPGWRRGFHAYGFRPGWRRGWHRRHWW